MLQIHHCKRIEWFKDIHNYPVHNFKPFSVTLPTPRGSKNLIKGLFLACLHSVSSRKNKQNQSKNVLSYDIISFHRPVSIPQDTQKNSTHYSINKLSKNGIKIKFTPSRFFYFFSLKIECYDIYFF